MKLRQKLAAVLATAMVVSAVPVVTMADSTNKLVKTTAIVKEDQITTSSSLQIAFDHANNNTEEFYLTLTNAKWLDYDNSDAEQTKALNAVGFTKDATNSKKWTITLNDNDNTSKDYTVTYTRQDDTTMKVNVPSVARNAELTFPLPVVATGGAATVAVSAEGSISTTITEGKYTFASTVANGATLAVDKDLNAFFDEGELSKMIVKETYVGSLTDSVILKVELENTDFEFSKKSNVQVKGTYGFDFNTAVAGEAQGVTVDFHIDSEERSTGYVEIKNIPTGRTSLGRIEITGLKVDNDEKEINEGKLLADISSTKKVKVNGTTLTAESELDKTYTNVEVANITNYGAFIEMKDQKAVDIVAGRDKEVEFTVGETVDDCFAGGRKIELTLDNDQYDESFFWIQYREKDGKEDAEQYVKDLISKDEENIIDSVEIVWNKDDEDKIKEANKNTEEAKRAKDKFFRADSIKVTLKDTVNVKNGKADKFNVKTKIYVPINQKAKENLSLVASMKGIKEFKSATAVNVINPFDVTFETTTLKVGLQKQKAGKIVIAEQAKEMFQKGNIELNVTATNNTFNGIVIDEKGNLTVSGDLKKADLEEAKGTTQKIEIKRQSKEASTLTIEDMVLSVDRTVPEGTYDLEIGGTAIDAHGGTLKLEDYIVIGTSNTEDLTASNGLAKGTVTFTMGNDSYTLNGVEKAMDAKVYIQDPGYTMVPVRYVAEAFGVSANNIIFGSGTVTIFAGTRTIQLTNNSSVAVVNGANVTMATKVVIKEGRTYAPIGEIARILGISAKWDNETKTATFENK